MSGHEQTGAPFTRHDSETMTTLMLSHEALSVDLMHALKAEIETLRGSGRLLVLRGSNTVFCRGMAVETLADWPSSESTRTLHQSFQDLLVTIQSHDSATLAAVEGDAFGGGVALAAACDFLVATETARFALPELLWGLLPANAAPFVVGRMGIGAARRMALLTEPLAADLAHAQGLVDFVAPSGAKFDGIIRRLALRAKRLPDGAVIGVRSLFQKLQEDPDSYPQYATDIMTNLTDDPVFRQTLSEKFKQIVEP